MRNGVRYPLARCSAYAFSVSFVALPRTKRLVGATLSLALGCFWQVPISG